MYGATIEQAAPWIKNFGTRLDEMVLTLRKKFPGGCRIFLANIYDPWDGTGGYWLSPYPAWPDCTKILEAYNRKISECASRHDFVHLVDIHQAFLGHGFHCTKFWSSQYRISDPHRWYNINVEDPNDREYDATRRLFLLKMIEVFSAGRKVQHK